MEIRDTSERGALTSNLSRVSSFLVTRLLLKRVHLGPLLLMSALRVLQLLYISSACCPQANDRVYFWGPGQHSHR